MTLRMLEEVLSEELGIEWRREFQSFEDKPAASASLGQVHRAVWSDGTDVAVKIQYPGAAKALRSDLRAISRLGRLFAVLAPGIDLKALLAEIEARATEELDYELEASAQRVFAAEYADDPEVVVPRVLHATPRVLVTSWLESEQSIAGVIRNGTPEERDRAGFLYATFLVSSPHAPGCSTRTPTRATSGCSPTPARRRRLRRGRPPARRVPAPARRAAPTGLRRRLGTVLLRHSGATASSSPTRSSSPRRSPTTSAR
jgi:hypothetical protein